MAKLRQPTTPLRERLRQDLKLRNYSPHTIESYVRSVAQFAKHFGTSPDRLGPEHIRTYQLFLIENQKVSWSTFIQTVCALRFFYDKTLSRPGMVDHIPFPKKPTLPGRGQGVDHGASPPQAPRHPGHPLYHRAARL